MEIGERVCYDVVYPRQEIEARRKVARCFKDALQRGESDYNDRVPEIPKATQRGDVQTG
jgi:hypothetical protein